MKLMVVPKEEHGLEQNVRGMVPVRLFLLKSMVRTLVIDPSTLGTAPLKPQPCRSNSAKFVRDANDGGIVALDMRFPVK